MALALAAIVFGAACSATTGSAAPSTPQPFPDDVPYTLTFPEGWTYVTGDGAGWEAYLDEVGRTDPREAERLADWVATWLTRVNSGQSTFGAAENIKPFVSCSEADTGGRPAAEMLMADEQQTVEGIATAPHRRGRRSPTTFRCPWERPSDTAGVGMTTGGRSWPQIAYAFVAGDMLIVCLFQSSPGTVATPRARMGGDHRELQSEGSLKTRRPEPLAALDPTGRKSPRDGGPVTLSATTDAAKRERAVESNRRKRRRDPGLSPPGERWSRPGGLNSDNNAAGGSRR